jgi:hypothetical protein
MWRYISSPEHDIGFDFFFYILDHHFERGRRQIAAVLSETARPLRRVHGEAAVGSTTQDVAAELARTCLVLQIQMQVSELKHLQSGARGGGTGGGVRGDRGVQLVKEVVI